jgi:hypothetical protein
MKTGRFIVLSAVLLVFAAFPAWTHHSAAAFDFGKNVEIEGVVQKIDVVNPHMELILRVTDTKGARNIEYEGHSRNNVYRSGWRDGVVKVGDKIKISIAPKRDGSDGGYVRAFVTATGEKIGITGNTGN